MIALNSEIITSRILDLEIRWFLVVIWWLEAWLLAQKGQAGFLGPDFSQRPTKLTI
jgi:hypothetical protein